jgi:hypothetical protein
MRRAALKIAEVSSADHDDRAAMGAALDRLFGAATQSVHEIVATLSESERARLAVFCYGRAHLNATGLTIAASCRLEQLLAAAHSPAAGRAIFAQARDAALAASKPPAARRSPISLASFAARRPAEADAEPVESLA